MPSFERQPVTTKKTTHACGLADLRFASWMELAHLAANLRWQDLGTRVVVRLLDLQGNRAWWGVTMNNRWLRASNGAVTIFDSLLAADRFLRLLKVDRFMIGEHCEHALFIAGQAQEVYTLGQGCRACDRTQCGAAIHQDIFQCLHLTQQRLAMKPDTHSTFGQLQHTPAPVLT